MDNVEVAKDEAKQYSEPVAEFVESKFVGGEIHIIADATTGEMRVNAPQNLVIALGLIEAGKMILQQRQAELMKKAEARSVPPAILRADVGALNNLKKLQRPS